MSTQAEQVAAAVAEYLKIPREEVLDGFLSWTPLSPDRVFWTRALYVVQVSSTTYVLRVMTSPLANKPTVHEEARL